MAKLEASLHILNDLLFKGVKFTPEPKVEVVGFEFDRFEKR